MAFFYAGMGLAMMTALYSIFQVNLARMKQLAGQGQDYNITNRFRDQIYSGHPDAISDKSYAMIDRQLLAKIANIKSCKELDTSMPKGYEPQKVPLSGSSLSPSFDTGDLCIYEKKNSPYRHRVLIGSVAGMFVAPEKKYKLASCVVKEPGCLCYFEVDHSMSNNNGDQKPAYFGQCKA